MECTEPDEKVVDAHENEQIKTEEGAAYEKATFTSHVNVNVDGTVSGHFVVLALALAFLRKILEAMTAPRRTNDQQNDHQTIDPAARRGQAFASLLERLPTDHLHSKSAATVVVHLDADLLRGALKAAGLDTAAKISAGEARRLVCSAGILPAVLS